MRGLRADEQGLLEVCARGEDYTLSRPECATAETLARRGLVTRSVEQIQHEGERYQCIWYEITTTGKLALRCQALAESGLLR